MKKNGLKRVLSLVMVLAMVLAWLPLGARAAAPTNLALNKPATASNVESGTSFTADKAVDGSTAGTSRWATNTGVTNPWIEIDLDDGSVLKQFNIMFERSGDNQNILGFNIQAEINGTYETIYTYEGARPAQHLKIVLPQAVTADKMKLTVTSYDGGTSNWASVSIVEIEAYSTEFKSLNDVAGELADIAGTVVEGDELNLPTYEGVTVTLNGADFEQVIAADGTVHKPLTDKAVNVSFNISDEAGNSTLTADIPVTVKGLYTQDEANNAKPQVIPEIQEWYSDSTEKLAASALTKVTYDNASLKAVVDEFVADYADFTGVTLTAVQGAAEAGAFNFSMTAPDALLGDEGYTMQIKADRIDVASVSTTGNMYGMQTILQMTKLDGAGFPIGQMRDYPRFVVRGLLLDVARKPIAMNMIRDISRNMRYFKLNDLQIHLNDNYIWLEEYGTYANEDNGFNAYEAFRLESSLTNAQGEDPTAEDYFIKKDEMRDFIQSERVLGMNIVPEIDVPAHAMSFTKVWPELSVDNYVHSNGHTLIDHFNLNLPEAVDKIKAIFDDYTKGENPTFDSDTVVHIGADEFYLSGKTYREFFNEMVPYIKETNTIRLWGSLTAMNDNNQTVIIPEAIEDVQMNLWSAGWANFQDMFNMGFHLINTIDTYGYMVPNGNGNQGAYGDFLNLNDVFNNFQPNKVGSIVLPSSDERVMGAAFAIWNDNIDRKSSGLSESDIFYRFFNAAPMYAEKTWAATGQEKGSAAAVTELSLKMGTAPNTNPYFELDSTGDTHAKYDFSGMEDATENGRDLVAGTATVADGVLTLAGGNSYVSTPITKVGNNNELSFDITLDKDPAPGDILFECTPEYYTHDIRIMADGRLGFTRELHDYYFDYTLPVGETVNIKISAQKQDTILYVNGVEIGEAKGQFVHNGEVKKTNIAHSTFALPLERIGSEKQAISATIDNVVLSKLIIVDYSDASRDIPVSVQTATTGNYQTGYEATEGPANLVLDNNPSTIWHTDWYGTSRDDHWIQFELSEEYAVDGLRYLPRSGGGNGTITKYEIQISDNGTDFETVANGSWKSNGDWKYASFEPVVAKYVRLIAVNATTDNSYVFASAAEIRLTGEEVSDIPEDTTPDPTVPDETDPDETDPKETYPDEEDPDETDPVETQPIETQPQETKPQETTPEETKPEDEKPTVSECDKDDNCVLSEFADIDVNEWYHDGIHFCVEEGIMNGMGEGKFAPTENTTRAQLVTMLYRLAGEPSVEGKEEPFTDVTADDWFYASIVWAYENKVVNGVTATEFAPNANVTREQVATILHRYLGAPEGTGDLSAFPDAADVSEYAVAPMTWAVGEGLINGIAQADGTSLLTPAGNATRAQIATILMRHLTAE